MLMPYFRTASLFACLLLLTVFYGCQSAQQKVYQQASRSATGYDTAPYGEFEQAPSQYKTPGYFSPAPAPEPTKEEFPPLAPPGLLPPQPEKVSFKNIFSIRKVSQQQVESDWESFDSENMSETEEPAQKYLGLVPRHSSVSQNANLMNGKVKGLYAKMKSQLKSPGWIRNVSKKQEEVQIFDGFDDELSCIDSAPQLEHLPIQPKREYPQPVLPKPDAKAKTLPQLPPTGAATYRDNSWKVSVTLEQVPVSNFGKNYSTREDQLEPWPFSARKMQHAAQSIQSKKMIPVSTPQHLSVPAMLSQEKSTTVRKINFQKTEDDQNDPEINPLKNAPVVIVPRKVF